MGKVNQNSKIKGVNYIIHHVRAGVVLGEAQEPEELEVLLQFLQNIAKAIMAQSAILRRYRDFYKKTLEGLEKDLEDTNKEIDNIQKILVQYRSFQSN